MQRARHRGWIEFASASLHDIEALCPTDPTTFPAHQAGLSQRLSRLEPEIHGPVFADPFSRLYAAYVPVCLCFQMFKGLCLPNLPPDQPDVTRWRQELAAFLRGRSSHLENLVRASQNRHEQGRADGAFQGLPLDAAGKAA